MFIDTECLIKAKIQPKSKNFYVRYIWTTATTYNELQSRGTREQKVQVLQDLLMMVGYWVTARPPHPSKPLKTTNEDRWDALKQVAEQAGREAAQLGVRFLRAPADARDIANARRSYWLEFLDSHHRPGYELSRLFEEWLENPDARNGSKDFWEYIGAPLKQDLKVEYLLPSNAEKFRVEFRNGLLYSVDPAAGNADQVPFSTQGLTTVFSGKGWGIFVVDMKGQLYINSHLHGTFHHSTFLAGGAVQSAGEIVADAGLVRVVTCKSGHYEPTREQMRRFVEIFPQCPGKAIILPDWPKTLEAARFCRVAAFRWDPSPLPLKREQVAALIPSFARSPAVNELIDKIPSMYPSQPAANAAEPGPPVGGGYANG